METKQRSLELVTNDENQFVLKLTNYEELVLTAKEIVKEYDVTEINNDSDLKSAKDIRARFNKVIKSIDNNRLTIVRGLTGEFVSQCKELVKIFDEHESKLGNLINTYTESKKVVESNKPKVIKAELKFYDESIKAKLEQFAKENNCELNYK